MLRFHHRGPIRHELVKSAGYDNVDGIIERRIGGKLQDRCPDRQWAMITRQHKAPLGLAHDIKLHRQSIREANRQVVKRRFFAGLQIQINFCQRLSAIADNNEPFVEGHLDQGPFEIETAQTPLDLRLKFLLKRLSIDDTIQLGGNLLAEPSNVWIEARHANLDLTARKRRLRERSRTLEAHNMRVPHLSHPKKHSLLA